MKRILCVGLVTALGCMASEHSIACTYASLEGNRLLTFNCTDASCDPLVAIYDVGSDQATDLGFGTSLPDDISFEFWSFDLSPLPTGTFDLGSGANNNYATCHQCILIYQDNVNNQPQKLLFQTGGTLTVGAATPPGSAVLDLSWSNVTLAEVTLDPLTSQSTLVPGGSCYTTNENIFSNGFDG